MLYTFPPEAVGDSTKTLDLFGLRGENLRVGGATGAWDTRST